MSFEHKFVLNLVHRLHFFLKYIYKSVHLQDISAIPILRDWNFTTG